MVEKLLGVTVPKRAQYIQLIMMELAHCRPPHHNSIWAWIPVRSPASSMFQGREKIYEIYEEVERGAPPPTWAAWAAWA
jgi:NADH-quinone oxidoreductase subunit D